MVFHEKPITTHGWTGMGYAILDPDTGAGAYLIAGGGNGSYLIGLIAGLALTSFFAALLIYSGGSAVVLLLAMAAGFAIALEGLAFFHMLVVGEMHWPCFVAGLFAGIAPLGLVSTVIGGSLDKVIPMILTAIGYGEAMIDLTESRKSCMN